MEEGIPDKTEPNKIQFDEKNPRGETVTEILEDEEFVKLEESVKEHGVLVPLIVIKNNSAEKPFKLVDGERRLRAAIKTKRADVPIYIIEDSEVDARILAYHIHMLRKQWDKISEVNSIREIYNELKLKNGGITDKDIFKKLMKITNHKEHELKDLLILMKYDTDIIKKVQDGDLAMSYLIQIESSFISPLRREFLKIYDKYKGKKLRKILVEKAENGKLCGTRYLMDNVLKYFKDKERKTKFKAALISFLDNKNEAISIIADKMEKKKNEKKATPGPKPSKKQKKPSNEGKGTDVPAPTNLKSKLAEYEKQIIDAHIFDVIFNYLKESIIEFEKRMQKKFTNEKDLQNFIYCILRSIFSSTEFEDPTEKMCEKSNKIDFIIKDHQITFEIKFVRDKNHAKNIYSELAEDYPKYRESKYGKTIINYIYDPEKNITNHDQFKKELDKLLKGTHNYIQ